MISGFTPRVGLALILALAHSPLGADGVPDATAQARGVESREIGNDNLLNGVWDGIQGAQKKYSSGCGTLTETRTSKLLRIPLVFHGRFCASGMDKFFLEYLDPEPVQLVFNQDYLNITTGKDRKTTEVLKIGGHVKKTQAYFSGKNSIRNLKDNFAITVMELNDAYELRFVPRSQRFKQKLNYLVVTLGRNNYLLRSLEIDGTSGVNSVFTIKIDSLNLKLNEEIFKVYKQ